LLAGRRTTLRRGEGVKGQVNGRSVGLDEDEKENVEEERICE